MSPREAGPLVSYRDTGRGRRLGGPRVPVVRRHRRRCARTRTPSSCAPSPRVFVAVVTTVSGSDRVRLAVEAGAEMHEGARRRRRADGDRAARRRGARRVGVRPPRVRPGEPYAHRRGHLDARADPRGRGVARHPHQSRRAPRLRAAHRGRPSASCPASATRSSTRPTARPWRSGARSRPWRCRCASATAAWSAVSCSSRSGRAAPSRTRTSSWSPCSRGRPRWRCATPVCSVCSRSRTATSARCSRPAGPSPGASPWRTRSRASAGRRRRRCAPRSASSTSTTPRGTP